MVLSSIQITIATMIGIERPKDIGMDFSFASDRRMKEDDFFTMLERLEEEVQINLVDCAWRFETVKNLVDYIDNYR